MMDSNNSLDSLLATVEAEVLAIAIDYRPIFAQTMRVIVATEFAGKTSPRMKFSD